MQSKIKFKYRTDENGNMVVNPNDIIPSKDNKSIYGDDIEKNNKNYKHIEKSMIVQGINNTPIPVYRDGSLKGGHTRLHIALKHVFKEVKIRIEGDRPKTKLGVIESLIDDNVDLREKSYLHCLNEFIALENAHWETHKMRKIPKETVTEWVEKINSGTALPISLNVLDQLRLVKERDPNLFDDINSGKIKPGKAYKIVKNTKPRDKARTNREVMKWMSDKNFQNDIIKSFDTSRKSFLNNIGYTDEDGNFINVITGEFTDIEENAVTGMYSHILANTITSVFRRRMPKVDAQSPRKGGDPDTQFKHFDEEGTEPLRLETKFAQIIKNKSKFYGGQGATSINPHEYVLAVRQGLNRFCMIVATMDSKDWKSKSDGSVADFDDYMKKHYKEKGKTWYPIIGDVVLSNYDTQYDIIFEEIK